MNDSEKLAVCLYLIEKQLSRVTYTENGEIKGDTREDRSVLIELRNLLNGQWGKYGK